MFTKGSHEHERLTTIPERFGPTDEERAQKDWEIICAQAEAIGGMWAAHLADQEKGLNRIQAAKDVYGDKIINSGILYLWFTKNPRESGIARPNGQRSMTRDEATSIFTKELSIRIQKELNQDIETRANWLKGLFKTLQEITPYTEY